MGASLAIDEAREALRLAEAEPERAAALSAGIAERALETGDLATAAIAERAWGLANDQAVHQAMATAGVAVCSMASWSRSQSAGV